MAKKKDNFRKGFYKNRRVKHPVYRFGKNGTKHRFVSITHSPNTDGIDNLPLVGNPAPLDKRKAYIRPYPDESDPNDFRRRYPNWKFANEDEDTVNSVMQKPPKKPRK